MSGFERQLVKGILFRNGKKPCKNYEKPMEDKDETTPATAHENLEVEHLEVNVKTQKPEFETSIYQQEDIQLGEVRRQMTRLGQVIKQ